MLKFKSNKEKPWAAAKTAGALSFSASEATAASGECQAMRPAVYISVPHFQLRQSDGRGEAGNGGTGGEACGGAAGDQT